MTADEIARLREVLGKATRGQWFVQIHRHGSGMSRMIFSSNTQYSIAQMRGDPRPFQENEANAALIAALHNAAPELLAMAEWCVGKCETCEMNNGEDCGVEWRREDCCQQWQPAWRKHE